MSKLVVLYDWPHSQICMGCKNGEFITGDNYVNSDYICNVSELHNDGVSCPSFKEKEENIYE